MRFHRMCSVRCVEHDTECVLVECVWCQNVMNLFLGYNARDSRCLLLIDCVPHRMCSVVECEKTCFYRMQKKCTKNVKLHFQSMLKPYTLQVWAGPGAHQTGQCVAVCCSVLQCVAACCSVLQCAAVCCSVLQCVVVCCSPKRAAIAYAPTPF